MWRSAHKRVVTAATSAATVSRAKHHQPRPGGDRAATDSAHRLGTPQPSKPQEGVAVTTLDGYVANEWHTHGHQDGTFDDLCAYGVDLIG